MLPARPPRLPDDVEVRGDRTFGVDHFFGDIAEIELPNGWMVDVAAGDDPLRPYAVVAWRRWFGNQALALAVDAESFSDVLEAVVSLFSRLGDSAVVLAGVRPYCSSEDADGA